MSIPTPGDSAAPTKPEPTNGELWAWVRGGVTGRFVEQGAAGVQASSEERITLICGPILVAAMLLACLSPSIAFASSQGSCAATAVVASVPHVSGEEVYFDAVIVGQPSGYCYVRHGDVVAVKLPQEEAPKQLERGRPIALAGICSSGAMGGKDQLHLLFADGVEDHG